MTAPSESTSYGVSFYDTLREGSTRSAEGVWPVVSALLDGLPMRSIVDVGCGDGSWLRAAKAVLGIEDVIGVDGAYVLTSGALRIPKAAFFPCDLAAHGNELPQLLGRTFDLALSLEVAEHLPRSAADAFVHSLVRLAPVVLFSAAIPNQGGESHLNEECPEAWVHRFAEHGYHAIDEIRFRLWNAAAVKFWYRQNALVFVADSVLSENSGLAALAAETARRGVPCLVHPELLQQTVDALAAMSESHQAPVVRIAAALAAAIRRVRGR